MNLRNLCTNQTTNREVSGERIAIVGVGPGTSDHITQEAWSALSSAGVLVGSGRMLEALGELGAISPDARCAALPEAGMADAVVGALEEALASAGGAGVALVVSGDPGFYSLARKVTRHFGRERVRAVPGVSSLQLMACRVGRSWVDVATARLYGGECPDAGSLAQKLRSSEALFLLLGASDEAAAQVRSLAEDETLGGAWAAIGWDLGLPGEQVFEGRTLRELTRCPYVGGLAVLWLEENLGAPPQTPQGDAVPLTPGLEI